MAISSGRTRKRTRSSGAVGAIYFSGGDREVLAHPGASGFVLLDSMSIEVPAAKVERTFAVNANVIFRREGDVLAAVMLDGEAVSRPVAGQGRTEAAAGGVAADCEPLAIVGVIAHVPGDGATHEIGLFWRAASRTSLAERTAVTALDRWITAIRVA